MARTVQIAMVVKQGQGFYHTYFPKPHPFKGRAHFGSSLGYCTADLNSRLEECASASSVSVCWYVASFMEGGLKRTQRTTLESDPGQVHGMGRREGGREGRMKFIPCP